MLTPDQRRIQDRAAAPSPAGLVAAGASRGHGRSIFLGIAGTLFLHGAVALLTPEEFSRMASQEVRMERSLEVLLADPDETEREETFILTNPDVVSNPPDQTAFFSDREQQAAQEEPTDEGDPSLPDIEGEEPEPTQTIIRGEDPIPVAVEELLEELFGGAAEMASYEPFPERPVSGFEWVEEGLGLDVPVTPEHEEPQNEPPVFGVHLGEGETEAEFDQESEKAEESAEGDPLAQGVDVAREERVVPRPRPRLPQHSQGPTGTRLGSAPNVGTVAVDANFSEYGDYLARMLEVIVRKWHILAWDSLPSGEVGTLVSISFRIDAEGAIHGLEVLGSTAGLTATLICQDAISSRQPYGKWTADMREVLGDEQTIRIRFHYR